LKEAKVSPASSGSPHSVSSSLPGRDSRVPASTAGKSHVQSECPAEPSDNRQQTTIT